MHGNSKIARLHKLMDAQNNVGFYTEAVKDNPNLQATLDHWKLQYEKSFVRVYGKGKVN
jgi:hypothetical protein